MHYSPCLIGHANLPLEPINECPRQIHPLMLYKYSQYSCWVFFCGGRADLLSSSEG